MAITFDQVGAWSAVGGTTPFTVTRPTLVAGDVGQVRMYCIAVIRDYNVTATCTSNAGADAWTQIASFADGTTAPGDGTGSTKLVIWYRDFPGVTDTNPSVAMSGTATRTGCVLTFRKGASQTWDTPAALTAAITSWTNSSQVVTSSGTADIPSGSAVFAAAALRNASATFTRPTDGIGDDGSPTVTWNGNYVEAPATHQSSTTGNNLAADAGYRLVTTGAAGVNLTQTATISAAETGASVWVIQGLVPETHSGSAVLTGGGILTSAGQKGATQAITATGGGTLPVGSAKGAELVLTATGGGIVTSTGLKVGELTFSLTGSGTVAVTEATQRSFFDNLTGGGTLTVTAQGGITPEGRTLSTVALAQHLSAVLSDDWSVIQGPVSSLEAPALVLRADTPWIEPSAFCNDLERYAAVAVVTAASPADGERDLYGIILEVMNNLPEGWRFVSANAPVVDQSTGTALLAAMIRLEYANSSDEETS